MGKSPASCFKIISCAGDSVDHDDLQTPESKGSSDRRRWSFRKRSARHRVLSNSVSSETPLSANKENPESPAVSFQVQPDLTVPEKTSIIQLTEEKHELTEEKPELSAQLDSKLSDTVEDVDCKADSTLDEPSAIIIQASIRRLLAQQELLKQKNVVKLQAAVRGHIVRRHAVGTLRCVQSIIKMQALVRARQAERGKDNTESTLLGNKEVKSNATYTYVSIEKLLTNAFARQLMESTPRTTPMNIKCDPLKSDSSWKWLERWMSVSSVTKEGPQESELSEEQHKENHVHSDGEDDILAPSNRYAESADLTSGVVASAEASENRVSLISREADELDLYSEKSISSSSSLSNLNGVGQLKSTSDIAESAPIEMKVTESVPEKEETRNERDLPDQPETEVKKLLKKASNPAFIAAQSKFEELTSSPISAILPSPPSHDLGVESGLDKVPASSAAQIGSECGTELSISSTLDSPDRSVNGVEQHETKVPDVTEPPKSSKENLEIEANNEKPITRHESDNSAISESVISINCDESSPHSEKKEEAKIDHQIELESEASPRSHITVPESQATPASQTSVKPKRSKGKNNKSSSADKARNQDSGSRSSLEQLPENKNGKRRNSFGSAKVDHNKEQEARDSSSSNSLPSYMQATESARAKAIAANGSPRSSPDVHEKDIYIKKRHSLPGTNERQGSPRIQRSLSQAQQNAKGNPTNSPQGIVI
ncbi:protein iq-domain 32 [Phtheirospermum japonicum]|uniref:Protein iq-domain 32 n=1 Tax=Phtheirospermum japonicum TaxID=374723 RepID=A0A830CLA2_9LAMI|nr:protein iq-domain 32 [Phtheirospermum japonicum]